MQSADRWEVAELICVSTNFWYQSHGRPAIFSGGAETAAVFFDVYEALDPGCGVVAVDSTTGRLASSCFFHPRPTHVSLGIMNVHPNYFGRGVARMLLSQIIEFADRDEKPLRLVSSAMNLDSFSLYTRAGFVPRLSFQDMYLAVPPDGLPSGLVDTHGVQSATENDIPDMVTLEMEVAGISREKDFQYFLANRDGFWHTSVLRNARGELDGFLISCGHFGCNMIGPGAALTAEAMVSLAVAELDRHRGRTPVMVVPVQATALVQAMYRWGARNCETHFSQIRGPASPVHGVHIPTFLPESA
jgi:GNAT superfamily N-acetyltransferase